MERILYYADLSVRRACGFAALAIFTTMVGVSAMPMLAAKIGAVMSAAVALVLLLKAINAPRKPYRRTELWILLDRRHDLPETHAQRVLMGALRDTYLRYGRIAGWTAVILWAASVLLRLYFG